MPDGAAADSVASAVLVGPAEADPSGDGAAVREGLAAGEVAPLVDPAPDGSPLERDPLEQALTRASVARTARTGDERAALTP